MANVRREWFGCACCPPNLARLLASLGGYIYSEGPGAAWVHLYVGGTARLKVGRRTVVLRQETGYPWKETVRITVRPERPTTFTLALRIPGWCRGAKLTVNSKTVNAARITTKGYARIRRQWRKGDRVRLVLPMPVERIEAHPKVRHNCGRVAIRRGPVVYCLEEVDNGQDLDNLVLRPDAKLRVTFDRNLLGGAAVITGRALRRDDRSWRQTLYRPAGSKSIPVALKAVPYCLWTNREPGEMQVWIRQSGK